MDRYFTKEDSQMSSKTKQCSTSVVSRKVQIKTTIKYHDTSARMAKKFLNGTTSQRGCKTTITLIYYCLEQLLKKID